MAADCKPTCPCRAADSRDAVARTARFIGMDADSAASLVAMLRTHGWKLTKDAQR